MSRLVIYGAGGFGRELVLTARGLDIAFMSDAPVASCGLVPIVDRDALGSGDRVVIAIADAQSRRRIAGTGLRFGRLIAPTALIGADVTIGEGAILCDHAMVTGSAVIGRHVHLNIYSYVAHDCRIGDFVTFAPRASCNGNVHVGEGAFIGAGAVIRHGLPGRPIRIGAGAVVGMGAVVTRDVPDGATVVGNPARPIERLGAGRRGEPDRAPRGGVDDAQPGHAARLTRRWEG